MVHQLLRFSKVEPLVLPFPAPLPWVPLKRPLPFPLPLGSRGGGRGFGVLGLGCNREEISDLTTVISLRHSSRDQVPFGVQLGIPYLLLGGEESLSHEM